MDTFVARHAHSVTSTLSGFDRIVFRGTLQLLVQNRGMHMFLGRAKVLLLDFKKYALGITERLKSAVLAEVERAKRPIRYIDSPKASKEGLAREILADMPLKKPGIICAFTAVEPCMSFEYHRSQDPSARGLRLRRTKCQHIYKCYLHPIFGFMSARIQTWFPFNVQICMNGREWLSRELRARRSRFKQADNCFTWLADPALAQRLMDEQLESHWPDLLTAIARDLNPIHDEVFAPWPMHYYWSGYQTEWATDVAFREPRSLAAIYPALVRHAMNHFQSPDVMRFLANKLPHGNYTGEIMTSFKNRAEGVRVKHWLRGNSIKMYDKAGSVLRVETTIAETSDFKVLRPAHDNPDGKLEWLELRKGVADLHRRAQVSQRSNQAYLEALAVVDDTTPCSRVFDAVSRPVTDDGRHFRPMRLGDRDDLALLHAISRGEFATTGFRNRDLRRLLHAPPKTVRHEKRLSGKVSRQLRLLRAHGIIRKIPKTHRYQISERGRLLTAALRATRDASLRQLLRQARSAHDEPVSAAA